MGKVTVLPCVRCKALFEKQEERILALVRLLQEEEMRSGTDELTQLANRRTFNKELDQAIARLSRRRKQDESLALAILDIDFFKRINDVHGHPVGDQVLQILGGILKRTSRASDIVARIGGEEFAIIFDNATVDGAAAHLEKLRKRIRKEIRLEGISGVTVSIGVTEFKLGETAKAFCTRADRALYVAKKTGRDKVVSE